MYIFSFEKLEVWKNSVELTKLIYQATGLFPSEEKFGLVSQMRRAAISISSNIAEGNSRKTNKDKSHFTTIAYSSLMELMNQSILSNKLDFLTKDDLEIIREKVTYISNQLNKLRNYQNNMK